MAFAERQFARKQHGAAHLLLAPGEEVAESIVGARWEGTRYRLPSFGGKGPARLPVDSSVVDLPPAEELTGDQIMERIYSLYPQARQLSERGTRYGIYVKLRGAARPELWYLAPDENGQPVLRALFLYLELAGQRNPLGLQPGYYLVSCQSTGSGRLVNLARGTSEPFLNPDALDLVVVFSVGNLGPTASSPTKAPYRFYPQVRLIRLQHESPLAVESQSDYAAAVDIWELDEQGRPSRANPLAFIFAELQVRWSVYRVKPHGDPGGELIHTESGHEAFFSYTWASEGSYRISCKVTVRAPEMSPTAVSDSVREDVMKLEMKLAWLLGAFEGQQTKPGGPRIWAATAADQIQRYQDEIDAENASGHPNERRIQALREAIDKMRGHLFPPGVSRIGPIPIHAVFLEKRTSKVQPINLFLSFTLPGSEDDLYHCYLVDVTYPAFYATYEGTGLTPIQALIDAFETSRTSFRRTYPPGHILAQVTVDDLRGHGLSGLPGFVPINYVTETNSWQKEAMEWLTIGVQILGAAALIASFVFPPSAVIAGALLVAGTVGAAIAAVNIVERIEQGNFAWDVETFSDIGAIAAGLVGAGAAVSGMKAASMAAVLARAEAGTAEEVAALAKLATALKWQRAILLTGLGLDVANGLLVSYDTYRAISDYASADDAQLLSDYQAQFGKDEGERRWKEQREMRLLSILVRAGLNGAMIVVSARSNVRGAKHAGTGEVNVDLLLEERLAARGPREVRAPTVSIPAPAGPPPTATELLNQASRVETRLGELRAEADMLEGRANRPGTDPARSRRLLDQVALRRRTIAMVEADVAEIRAAAVESEAAARRTELPSPDEIDQLIDQARSDHEPFRIRLGQGERRSALDPTVLPRLRRALTTTSTGNRVVYRVEGGTGTARSKELVTIGPGGSVTLSPNTSLNLNFGSYERALEFLQGRPGGRIVAFEVPEKWLQQFRSAAIPEGGTTELTGQSRLVDVEAAHDQIQVNPDHIGELQRQIVANSGRVITP